MFGRKKCKCKCDCEYKLFIQKIEHHNHIEKLEHHILKVKRDLAYLEYKITGNEDALHRLEYELKNGFI